MTEILLIRHGETTWNAERRLQGHSDIALNTKGEYQAEALSQALQRESFDAIVSSDLLRAKKTAEVIAAKHGLRVLLDERLRERCYGVFEGLTYTEISDRYPAAYTAWQARQIDSVMPSGVRAAESFSQFYQRSLSAISHWAQYYRGKKIALVAHGGVLECAYRAALSIPLDTPRNFPVFNAAINRFTYTDDQLTLTSWGEVAHLDELVLDEIDQRAPLGGV